MKPSRFVVTRAERARLWDVVAAHRKRAGDRDGAAMATWQAKSIRSDYPVERARQRGNATGSE